MSLQHPTRYKFRHYRPDAGGVQRLIWASNGPDDSAEFDGTIAKGTAADLEVVEWQAWSRNELANEGEIDILDVYFDDQAVRANTYFRLWQNTLTDAATLATASEVTGTDYPATGAEVTLVRGTDWGAPAAGPTGTLSTTKTFTAGAGGWDEAETLVLATAATGTSGLLIAYVDLSTPRTLAATETLDVSMRIALD